MKDRQSIDNTKGSSSARARGCNFILFKAEVAAALRSLDPRLLQRPAPQHNNTSALPNDFSCSRHIATSFVRGYAK
jgi:hypothetical protein